MYFTVEEQSGSDSGSGGEKEEEDVAWKPVTSPPSAPDNHCKPLSIPMCKSLPYSQVSYPNSLNHQTQDEAGIEIHQFYPLVKVKCSSSLLLFLCVIYAPPCQNDPATNPLLPCKSLCEKAKTGCAPLMNKFGFEWPDALSCEKFPDEESFGQPCISSDDQLGNRY